MPIIERLLKADKQGSICSHYEDVVGCKGVPEFIIINGAEFDVVEILLCEYCLIILLGEITYLLKQDERSKVKIEVVGGKETELRMPVYTFKCCTCNTDETKEMFGGTMARHLIDVHDHIDEDAYKFLDELIK